MRHSRSILRRVMLTAFVVAAFAAAPLASPVALPPGRLADAYDQQIAALQAQYDGLGNQLGAVHSQSSQVTAQILSVQEQIAHTQASITAAQARVTQLQATIDGTQRSIQADTVRLGQEKSQLSQLMVAIYTTGGASVVDSLVDSQSLDDFMNKLDSAIEASHKFQQLIASVKADQEALQALQQTEDAQLTQTQQLEAQLDALQSQLQGQQAQFQEEAASLSGQSAQLVAERTSIEDQIQQLQAEELASEEAGHGWVTVNGALAPFAFGPQTDNFPWGQCTWYVASLRDVYWGGNADQWFSHAQAAGASTGQTPRAGAIVVWGPGYLYDPLYGHVAYVRYVISPTEFVVDEGNYLGLGVSDQRDVPTLYDVEGFIY